MTPLNSKRKTRPNVLGPTPAEKQRRVGPSDSLQGGNNSTTVITRSVNPLLAFFPAVTTSSSTVPPNHNHHGTRFQPIRPSNISSQEWRRMRKHQHRQWSLTQKAARSTAVKPLSTDFDLKRDSRVSKPTWMGLNTTSDLRKPIQEAILQTHSEVARCLFSGITAVPYVP